VNNGEWAQRSAVVGKRGERRGNHHCGTGRMQQVLVLVATFVAAASVAHAFFLPQRHTTSFSAAATPTAAPDRGPAGGNYTEDQLLLRAKRGASAAYAVVLPKGFDASLSSAEKEVADRIEEAKNEGKTDLDLLKEELRRTLDGWQ